MQRYIPLVLFFGSGFTALMLETLWMQQLGILFGNSAYAASITLGVFFAGLALGSHYWGKISTNSPAPLKIYGFLEIAVSVSALTFLFLFQIFSLVYDEVFGLLGSSHGLFTLFKAILAFTLIFPAAFFMGGTLPAMGQFLIQKQTLLGRLGSFLYAINTFGAALGAFCSGFIFFPIFGFFLSYSLALLLVLLIGGSAIFLSFSPSRHSPAKTSEVTFKGEKLAPWLMQLSFMSGFASLCLQVLWTRMFAQVLHNSVYTYSIILVMFLTSIGFGAALAHRTIRANRDSHLNLFIFCCISGLTVASSPFIFYALTGGLNYIGEGQHWLAYMIDLVTIAMLSVLLPGIFMGSLFPFLFAFAQRHSVSAGSVLGQLSAMNTLGAIFGSLLGGFVLLNYLGMWASIRLMALAYFLMALILFQQMQKPKMLLAPSVGILLLFTLLDSAQLPSINIDPIKKKEALLQLWEGASGTVAVVQKDNSLQIKVNNYYTLGSTRSRRFEERQAQLPLLIHGQAKSIYFIGLGTGITAGAALRHPIEKLVVTELIPEVVKASKYYFADQTHALHKDKRVRIIPEDGRNFLRASKEQFDVVVSDLFVPWRAGIGSAYSLEHFQQVKQRLKQNGVFAQWLPLYQLTYEEFAIISKTFLQVFPNTQLWRGDFFAQKPVVALIGHQSMAAMEMEKLKQQINTINQGAADPRLHLLFYCGNLGKISAVFKDYPINTDDNRLIEFGSPQSHRKVQAKESNWFIGKPLIEFFAYLLRSSKPEQDAYFSKIEGNSLDYIRAGFYLQQYNVLNTSHEPEAAQRAFNEFKIITGISSEIN